MKSTQSGAALLMLLTALLLAASWLLLSDLTPQTLQASAQQQTARALAQAKQALLGYAIAYSANYADQPPGYFPCPDLDNNGSSDPPCSGKGLSVIGRLPWKTLGIEQPRDGAEQDLWYAVSGDFKNNPKGLTTYSNGLFVVQNEQGLYLTGTDPSVSTPSSERALVVIFAPGQPIPGQARAVGNQNNAAHYLDSWNNINNATGTFTSATAGEPGENPLPTASPSMFLSAPPQRDADNTVVFNDTLVFISMAEYTALELQDKMQEWVEAEIKDCFSQFVNNYAIVTGNPNPNNHYPWPAALTNPLDYDDDKAQCFGRIPSILDSSYASNDRIPQTWSTGCFPTSSVDWWSAWREEVFIAVRENYSPKTGGPPGESCSGASTLKLDSDNNVNLVILFAGPALVGQSRATAADKANIANYLEGENANGDTTFANGTASSTFNDVAIQP